MKTRKITLTCAFKAFFVLPSSIAHPCCFKGPLLPCRAPRLCSCLSPLLHFFCSSTIFRICLQNAISWLSETLAILAWNLPQVSIHTPTQSCLNIIIEGLCRSIWIQQYIVRRRATAKKSQWWQLDRNLFLTHLVVWTQAVLLDPAVPEV